MPAHAVRFTERARRSGRATAARTPGAPRGRQHRCRAVGSGAGRQPNGLRHDVPLTVDGYRAFGQLVTDTYALYDNQSAGALRWIGAPPTGRVLASIGPIVYRQLAGGHVPVITSIGGEARAIVRSGRRLAAQRQATVAAGAGDVFLGRSLPQGNYRVELTVTNGSQITTHRLGVSTRRTLSLRRGTAAIRRGIDVDGGGDAADGVYFTAKRCRRVSATRVSCAYLAVSYSIDRSTTRCAGTVSAYLRGDGIRIVRDRTRARRCKLAR